MRVFTKYQMISAIVALQMAVFSCSKDEQQAEEATEIEASESEESPEDMAKSDSEESEAMTAEDTLQTALSGDEPIDDQATGTDPSLMQEIPQEYLSDSPDALSGDTIPTQDQVPAVQPAQISDPTGRSVWYVRANATPVHSQPNTSADSIGKLNRGDNVLIKVDGDWGELSPGRWVQIEGLSRKPVGRNRNSKAWIQSH